MGKDLTVAIALSWGKGGQDVHSAGEAGNLRRSHPIWKGNEVEAAVSARKQDSLWKVPLELDLSQKKFLERASFSQG